MSTFLTVILFLALAWLIPVGILAIIAVGANDYDIAIWPFSFLRYKDYPKDTVTLPFEDFINFYQLNPSSWHWNEIKISTLNTRFYFNAIQKETADFYLTFHFTFKDYFKFKSFIKELPNSKLGRNNNPNMKELIKTIQQELDTVYSKGENKNV